MKYELDKLPIKVLENKYNNSQVTFILNNKKYYFKSLSETNNISFVYYELIAKKIADRLGIPCCNCYYATYNGKVGVLSEFIDDKRYVRMDQYLAFHYNEDEFDRNSLEDLWDTFIKDFSESTVKRLMNELINIFIFDILIANKDRNTENYGLILDGDDTNFAPLFDNEQMLSKIAMNYGYYWIGVNYEDCMEGTNILEKFLLQSSDEYMERLNSKLDIINKENISLIIEELKQEGIDIEEEYQKKIITLFEENREIIFKSIEKMKNNSQMTH